LLKESKDAMSLPTETIIPAGTPLFDVVIRVPQGARLGDIEQLAREVAGMPSDRVANMIKALRSIPEAKVGAGVTREKADKAKEQFIKAGLHVEITPVLGIAEGPLDSTQVCPGCRERVDLPANRQCPKCGVYVDKMTDEYLLRKKIMDKERGSIASQLNRNAASTEKSSKQSVEDAIRASVRKELEKEYGINQGSFFKSKTALVGLVAALGLGAAAYAGGDKLGALNPFGPKKEAKSVDKMLAAVGPAGAAGAGAAAGGAPGSEAAGAAGTATGDPDIDDPLIQAAGGKRIGAKGLTMEEAVAAANVLGKSVGNTTADRALKGGAGAPGAPGATGVASAADATTAAAAGTGATPGAAAAGSGAGGAEQAAQAAVPKQAKQLLTVEFAKQLAEIGQGARAREVIKAMKAAPGLAADPAVATAVQIADLEVHAWAIGSVGNARQAIDALKSDAANIGDAADKTYALGRVAVILSRNPQLPAEAARVFLTLAAESLKSLPAARQQGGTAGNWAVALGEVLVAEATSYARTGAWGKAKAAAAQLETLTKDAPDDSSMARLNAVGFKMNQLIGQSEKAQQNMQVAVTLAAKQGKLPDQATWLRNIAQLSGVPDHEKIQAAITTLQAQAAGKSGMDKAQTLATLALLYADAGSRSKVSQFIQLTQSTSGLSAADTVSINSDLLVLGDLSLAKALHGFGMYPDTEVLLQRVGGYLL
jgi:hypothetical protein